MNQCKTFILPHGDTDGRFWATKKMIFLVQYSFHAVECIILPCGERKFIFYACL